MIVKIWDGMTLCQMMYTTQLWVFIELYELENLEYNRSLWPKVKVMDLLDLVVFSDSSQKAFGAVIYIRWRVTPEKWWSTLKAL